MRRLIIVHRQTDLLQIILTMHSTRRLASSLDSWKQQGNEYPNDGDHNQKLNQSEASLVSSVASPKPADKFIMNVCMPLGNCNRGQLENTDTQFKAMGARRCTLWQHDLIQNVDVRSLTDQGAATYEGAADNHSRMQLCLVVRRTKPKMLDSTDGPHRLQRTLNPGEHGSSVSW